ncbi:MAG: ribosomal L7Ae/L30e/S12e/Gadd45 family protein [Holdemanella sp.]|nr:ribosomal L7Ae/L30e/S12e/Gadd45 family protein [Holdemanella sp.]
MNKITNLCQLAFRAGKVSVGDALIPSIQSKKAQIVLYAKSCGNNRKKKLNDKCKFYNIPCYELNDEIFSNISHRSIQSLAITDKGFAVAIQKEMKGLVI